ncbi:Metallo-dependent phosphatase [Laetiporus sulphureus 93-53]|uniref:Metallo-dependent phosphatase n=1 Tax=Laetiporus sulphureus 93-53 TaxID=1314785 RepID=A0A165DEF9_9APHY|nr:Metallo-dependent phosphatase [Laetiporus sulphureus 93-53]KZT04704.1 Metallo-dependent phosphatase [Laetiporus sulphureus 93-53]
MDNSQALSSRTSTTMTLGRPRKLGIARPYHMLAQVFQIIWLAVICYNEYGTFRNHVSHCPWPDHSLLLSTGTSSEDSPRPTHVLVLADPQVLDANSYPGRHPLLVWITRKTVDMNLRKSWRAALNLKPDAVVFLGDMMDNGRAAMSDEEYEDYYQHFRRIFRPASEDPLLTFYIPGNHDIGLGRSARFSEEALERYTSHFGPLNQLVDIGGHTLVMINAPGLVQEETLRADDGLERDQWALAHPTGTIAFVELLRSRRLHNPAVLFTHIPLSRPEGASCGPLRERGTIREGRGFGYENTLAPHTSQFLLQTIRPALVFSGDDHDYCEYAHPYPTSPSHDPMLSDSPPGNVIEVTVKSFSIVMGIRQPGFQLLSLSPLSAFSPPLPTLATTPCALPATLRTYLFLYAPLAAFTLLALLFASAHRIRTRRRWEAWAPLPRWCERLAVARGWSSNVSLCGRRVRVVWPIPNVLSQGEEGKISTGRTRAVGFWEGWARDVARVAWLPTLVFGGIAWWTA